MPRKENSRIAKAKAETLLFTMDSNSHGRFNIPYNNHENIGIGLVFWL